MGPRGSKPLDVGGGEIPSVLAWRAQDLLALDAPLTGCPTASETAPERGVARFGSPTAASPGFARPPNVLATLNGVTAVLKVVRSGQ
jgi:hypothetical protein